MPVIRFLDRSVVSGLLAAACVAFLAAACDFHYRAAVVPVEDEVLVWVVPSDQPAYDHPARLSSQKLTSILREVRVQFESNWLQRLITGPLEPVPLFDAPVLARVGPSLAEALEKAGPRDRIVFYVAQRRTNERRDVTSGALFLKGRSLTIALTNYQNRVDVVPGLALYDRTTPEVAVAPQHFALRFNQAKYVIEWERDIVDEVFKATPPKLMVDYAQFLQDQSRGAAASGS